MKAAIVYQALSILQQASCGLAGENEINIADSDLRFLAQKKLAETMSEKTYNRHRSDPARDTAEYYNFHKLGSQYVRITEKGEEQLEHLSARLSRLNGESYGSIEKEIETIYAAINERYKQYKKAHKFLVAKDFVKGSDITKYAICLSQRKGKIQDAYKRAKLIYDSLSDLNKDDRLIIATTLAMRKGRAKDLRSEYNKTLATLVKQGYKKSRFLCANAVNIMKIPGNSLENKIKRYEEFGKELCGKDWDPKSEIPTKITAKSKNEAESQVARYNNILRSRNIAAYLAQKKGSAKKIIDNFKQHLALLEKKFCEPYAEALLLMNKKGRIDHKVNRAIKAFEPIKKQGGLKWASGSGLTAAAAISIMPGTIEENFELFDYACDLLNKQEPGRASVESAMTLIGGALGSIANAPSPPPYLFDIESKSKRNDDGLESILLHGLAGAVIGDVFDNGDLDFSEGFVIGGILGIWFDLFT